MNTHSRNPSQVIFSVIVSLTVLCAPGCWSAEKVVPMATRDFEFVSGNKTLSGIIDQPVGGNARALIVFVHGSGPTDIRKENRYSDLRRRFAELRITCVVWDKPGQGKSQGTFDENQPLEDSALEPEGLASLGRLVRHSSTFGQPQIRSRDQLREFLSGEAVTFPGAHETVHFLVAEGDMVAVHSAFRGTQRGTMGPFPAGGRSLSADFISIYRVTDGRIAEAWVEWDCLSGLIQLGHFTPPSAQQSHATSESH